jgi:hypothetical protein
VTYSPAYLPVLLSKGLLDVNTKSKDNGDTPLHVAVKREGDPGIRYYTNLEINIYAIIFFVLIYRSKCIRFLLNAGADKTIKNQAEQTPKECVLATSDQSVLDLFEVEGKFKVSFNETQDAEVAAKRGGVVDLPEQFGILKTINHVNKINNYFIFFTIFSFSDLGNQTREKIIKTGNTIKKGGSHVGRWMHRKIELTPSELIYFNSMKIIIIIVNLVILSQQQETGKAKGSIAMHEIIGVTQYTTEKQANEGEVQIPIPTTTTKIKFGANKEIKFNWNHGAKIPTRSKTEKFLFFNVNIFLFLFFKFPARNYYFIFETQQFESNYKSHFFLLPIIFHPEKEQSGQTLLMKPGKPGRRKQSYDENSISKLLNIHILFINLFISYLVGKSYNIS